MKFNSTLVLSAMLIIFSDCAMATSIGFGTADTAGTVVVTNTSISFFDVTGTIAHVFNTGLGTGSFVGLTSPGTIKDLTGGPITGPISVAGFATFMTAGGIVNFDLSNVDPGSGTVSGCSSNTIGNSCTPNGSPFTLTQVTASTVAFTFSIEGLAYRGLSTTGTSLAQALFTGQRVPGTITGTLAQLASTGSITNTYSATFSANAVPEPGTMFMMLVAGMGTMGITVLGRRRRSSN